MITNGQMYTVNTHSRAFKNRYGNEHPVVEVVGTDVEQFGMRWIDLNNEISRFYANRVINDGLPVVGVVYYCMVGEQEELIHESEIDIEWLPPQ
jgi:hypothetical protein